METSVLVEWIGLLGCAVFAVALFKRLRLPAILAYLLVGALIGPGGFGLIHEDASIRELAEFGVVFLLFTIGLEFSLPQLMALRRLVFGMGGAQVALTTALTMAVAIALGAPPAAAFVTGGVLTASSTAIVVRQLADQLELAAPHGQAALAVLLFQDLAVVPFLVVIGALGANADGALALPLLWALCKAVLVFVALVLAGRWLLRPLFAEIAHARSSELFTLAVLLVSLTAAVLTYASGLSLALGAFIAGVMLGETEFRHQVESAIRPFRDVLLGLFFVEAGMWIEPHALLAQWRWLLLLLAGVLLLKSVLVFALARGFGLNPVLAARSALALAQCGEFGFVMLTLAYARGLLDRTLLDLLSATIVLSMALAPLLLRYNGRLAARLSGAEARREAARANTEIAQETGSLRGHVVICGFGRVGQNVARYLERAGFQYAALDLDIERVREARAAGDLVGYGDSTRFELLQAAGLERAVALVVSYDDAKATFRILEAVRARYQHLPILVRTRDDVQLEKLMAAGATEVIPETLEGSLMLIQHLLALLQVAPRDIMRQVRAARVTRYRLLHERYLGVGTAEDADEDLARLKPLLLPTGAWAAGHTIAELDLSALDVALRALQRKGIRSTRPTADTAVQAGDVLVLYGVPEALARTEQYLLAGR
ncbi:monovalent cation:proton antiporter family protein [Plasticicumulans acidivorans]|uniref:Kef-type potassium/proton antiporter (CPA2 family) n=1 Tax=Plasticicumulans acidivorans TaxID=886464 RepID=A0A317N057_9GAMM|nr:monovalent cation:proton antiporter family protein [Plasticicumulans acidivorans]PWV65544.1 Kef-type potassium/proton antiporter (CPA2 family) [Plasticicumulans acidivorans]